jgi:hypothetical protein
MRMLMLASTSECDSCEATRLGTGCIGRKLASGRARHVASRLKHHGDNKPE